MCLSLLIFSALNDLVDIFKVIFTVEFLYTLTVMSVTLVILQIEIVKCISSLKSIQVLNWNHFIFSWLCTDADKFKFISRFQNHFIDILGYGIPLFLACWIFEQIIDRYEKSNIYQKRGWYTFPVKVQSIIPIILANTNESREKTLYLKLSACDTVKEVKHIVWDAWNENNQKGEEEKEK